MPFYVFIVYMTRTFDKQKVTLLIFLQHVECTSHHFFQSRYDRMICVNVVRNMTGIEQPQQVIGFLRNLNAVEKKNLMLSTFKILMNSRLSPFCRLTCQQTLTLNSSAFLCTYTAFCFRCLCFHCLIKSMPSVRFPL